MYLSLQFYDFFLFFVYVSSKDIPETSATYPVTALATALAPTTAPAPVMTPSPVTIPATTPAQPTALSTSSTLNTIAMIRSVVLPNEIRPYPQVNQENVKKGPKRTVGRTRIITSTPEKNSLEEVLLKRNEKVSTSQPAKKKKRLNNKENDSQPDFAEDFDLDLDPLHRPTPTLPSPKRSRTGRVIKKINKINL